jgi:hypothetical protein
MRLSATQVQLFQNCQRAWAWTYVKGFRGEPTKGQEIGSRTHEQLERYAKREQDFFDFTDDTGYVAQTALEHIPPRETILPSWVEGEFQIGGPAGHTYLGYTDLEIPPARVGSYTTRGVIVDYKTTSDLRWAKTEEELREDTQATLYATNFFRRFSEEIDVELRWIYLQTRGARRSLKVSVVVGPQETWNRFLKIEETAKAMAERESAEPLTLEPNLDFCGAYGGCPHQGRCNLSPWERMRAHRMNDLLNKLRNGTAPNQTPPNVLHLPVKPQAPTGNPLIRAVPVAPIAPTVAASAGMAPPIVPGQINPPEYRPPAPVAPLIAAAAVPVAAPVAEGRRPGRPRKTNPTTVAAAVTAAQALPATIPAIATGGGAPPVDVTPSPVVATQQANPAAVEAFRGTVPIKPAIGVLYLDCGPVGIPCSDAASLIARAKGRMAKPKEEGGAGLADYRFAEYGQGPGILALAVAEELMTSGVHEHLRLDTTTPEGAIVKNDFVCRAGLVVRA